MNRKGDEVAQMATEYSALEIAYFKAVVGLSFDCLSAAPDLCHSA